MAFAAAATAALRVRYGGDSTDARGWDAIPAGSMHAAMRAGDADSFRGLGKTYIRREGRGNARLAHGLMKPFMTGLDTYLAYDIRRRTPCVVHHEHPAANCWAVRHCLDIPPACMDASLRT